jgi:queuine tRNA-ribosyltransferase
MSALHVIATDPGTRARAGLLRTAHGDVRTPAFVPLATKGSVRGLEPHEVAGLGFDMVLGNTFHLMLQPGPELIAELGGLHRFMGWQGPIITDSGGFSMGHGSVADEIKGTGKRAGSEGAVLGIAEVGVRFRSYVDGAERFMGPEESMAVQAALGSDIALTFDECTPFHATREYTARSTERTHRWQERCLAWHREHGSADQLVYGIVQGGVYEDLRHESTAAVADSACDGIAIGGSLGQHKAQMYEVVGWSTPAPGTEADGKPRHLLGIGDIDDLLRGVELGVDTFDCAMPTRLGRHGVAIVPAPEARWRIDLAKARFRTSPEPILDGCPCPACAGGYSRAYLRHLIKAGELLAQRLVTLHNLTFVGGLMADLRAAIADGRLAEVAEGFRRGSAPAAVRARPAS